MATILIVEDDEALGYVLTRLLQQLGHVAHLARTVTRAREELTARTFELVFLDLHLGGASAVALLEDRALTLPRTILMSATGSGAGPSAGPQIAASYGVPFMTKYLDLEAIRTAIARAAYPVRAA